MGEDADAPMTDKPRVVLIDNAPGTIRRIDEIWAFIAVDDDGNEGICAAPLQRGMLSVPLIAADAARLTSVMPIAQQMADMFGRDVRLVKFSTRDVIKTLTPCPPTVPRKLRNKP
jgi:hypothetical protein